jgi:protein TonB
MPNKNIHRASEQSSARAWDWPNRVAVFGALLAMAVGVSQFAHADESAGTPALTQQQLQAGVNAYINQFPALLANTDAQLPPEASKLSGKALVAVELASNGRVLATKISKSSGNPLIDQFALDDVGSAHYPPFNAEMPYKSFEFTVPIMVMPPPPSTEEYAPQSNSSLPGTAGLMQ